MIKLTVTSFGVPRITGLYTKTVQLEANWNDAFAEAQYYCSFPFVTVTLELV